MSKVLGNEWSPVRSRGFRRLKEDILENGAHPGTASVQKDTLVGLGHIQSGADFSGGEAEDVPHPDDRLLSSGQALEGRSQTLAGLTTLGPQLWRLAPRLRGS